MMNNQGNRLVCLLLAATLTFLTSDMIRFASTIGTKSIYSYMYDTPTPNNTTTFRSLNDSDVTTLQLSVRSVGETVKSPSTETVNPTGSTAPARPVEPDGTADTVDPAPFLWTGNASKPCKLCLQADTYKLRHCHIPKTSSTSVRNLYLRLNNVTNELLGHKGSIRTSGVFPSKEDLHEWTTVAVFRDPHERLLSAYLDSNEYKQCEGMSFREWIEAMPEKPELLQNEHTSSQTAQCNMQILDIVIDYSKMALGMKRVLQGVGAWEHVGKSGWGKNGNQSFLDVPARPGFDIPGGTRSIMGVFYTDEMWTIVNNMLKDDMKFFPSAVNPPSGSRGDFASIKDYLLSSKTVSGCVDIFNKTKVVRCGCHERLNLLGFEL